MIYESHPWKAELLKDAEIIQRWAAKTEVSVRRETLLEKKVFISAYAMRKLMEAKKLTTRVDSFSLKVTTYPRTQSKISRLNDHRLDEHFNFDSGRKTTIGVRQLLNEIIHSRLFSFFEDETGRLEAFFVCSDQNIDKKGLVVAFPNYAKLMTTVGKDHVALWHYWVGADGEWNDRRE